ncbi:MAG: hypothetical protein JRJ59_11045, partial [Deltaproteobacteria bacterium]|nr:hypothetical protein [Deltaproteobacteria bacterium]
MTKPALKAKWEFVAVALGLGLYLALTWPAARAWIDDMAMIRAFGGDETVMVETVLSMLDRSSLDPKV